MGFSQHENPIADDYRWSRLFSRNQQPEARLRESPYRAWHSIIITMYRRIQPTRPDLPPPPVDNLTTALAQAAEEERLLDTRQIVANELDDIAVGTDRVFDRSRSSSTTRRRTRARPWSGSISRRSACSSIQ